MYDARAATPGNRLDAVAGEDAFDREPVTNSFDEPKPCDPTPAQEPPSWRWHDHSAKLPMSRSLMPK
jgi:hypothetical protein